MASSAHRKVVTVLFCDVVGSTALGESVDPEALQALLATYFERMSGIVESHGGTVEKFIGDAVMGVFGVPVAHEDDALRACRAAVEMREALPELGVEGRIGINTGEVLTGTEERLATGDAVNVAARLEQAAEPGEVLIGAETLALVASAVEVGEERLLELKGKAAPVAGHPLVAAREGAERSHASRFVGRERELQQLADAWDRALAGPRCELVTVVGDPGVGKSRLVAEALERIDARVVRGGCLSYGEGITYWPVVEVVKQVGALPSDEAAATAIRSLLGENDAGSGTDEIGWAFRKLIEEQAPLVVVFDDIQWGEETFLKLVESTALLSAGAPLLLLCMARPELLDRRPGWPAVLRLDPLPEEEAGALIGDAVPDEARERIVRASGGNPLFLTEMAALGEAAEVPATLRALLATRLDQLNEPERQVLERGAVEGELFHRGTVQALAPEEQEVTSRLAALVRRDLVRPDLPTLPREDAYRFRHLLIRDAAYDALPKATRADLHRRFADWLEEHGQTLVELDEILGYHLEQAALYLAELGQPDAALAELASGRLAAAGVRVRWRGDPEAAHSLLGRAVRLVEQPDVHLAVAFAVSHSRARDAEPLLEEAARRADADGDAAGAALARTLAGVMGLWLGEVSSDEAEQLGLVALPLLEAKQDHAGLAEVWYALGLGTYNHDCRFEQVVHATEMARSYEALVGRPHHRSDGLCAMGLLYGPRPVGEALDRVEALDSTFRIDLIRAQLLLMSNRIEEARALARAAEGHARELGEDALSHAHLDISEMESVSGNHEAAAERLQVWCNWCAEQELVAGISSYAAQLARELCLVGRYDEAEQSIARARELDDDAWLAQATWRQAAALLSAHRGEHTAAERLAREALSHLHGTDSTKFHGDAHCDLAVVLAAAGRRDEAIGAWREALDRYERKGVVPLMRRVRERLGAMAGDAVP